MPRLVSPITLPDLGAMTPFNRATPPPAAKVQTETAEVHIQGEIGGWGLDVDALCMEIAAIDSDAITIHLNSPGGAVFGGIALFNTLVEHPARVTVNIKGIAASIASVIAQAGDRIEIARTATFMIHDAWGYAEGNEADMLATAEILSLLSDQIADVYTARTGRGSVKSWRELMRAESWFTAAEAMEAGLVDEVTKLARREGSAELDDRWATILDRYRYSGRDHAPAPVIPGPRGQATPDRPADPDPGPAVGEDEPAPADPVTKIEVGWADLLTFQPGENQ